MTEAGRIVKIVSSRYEVLAANQEWVLCVAMGELRKAHSPVVGDLVELECFADQNGIQKVLPRKNAPVRPSIVNVDQAIIVMPCKDPGFSTTLIDRLIFSVCYAGIHPVSYITKLDLIAENNAIHEEIQHCTDSGYEVYQSGEGHASEDLIQALRGNISVLTGQSGAGKSFLLNRISPTSHLQIQEISKALGRGKHTTRHCELHEIAGGWVTDTPGLSPLDFIAMNITQLAECIPDFQNVQDVCRFRNRIHVNEPDCAIRAAVEDGTICREHHAHYLEIVDMAQEAKPWYWNSIQKIQYNYEGGHAL